MSNTLKEWLSEVEAMGELKRFSGVSEVLEIGAVTTLALERGRGQSPALLFENIPGYSSDYSILTNSVHTHKRTAMISGIPADGTRLEEANEWRRYLAAPRLIPPQKVASGPILQNVVRDGDIDLTVLPAPVWHEQDEGNRYLGTGSVTILKDPDTGRINLGTYRVMVHDRNTVGFYIAAGRHGHLIRERYFEQGRPCPVVVSLGHHPVLFMASTMSGTAALPEFDVAGGLRGAPVEYVEGEYTGLPIPAHAEIVIEGESYPGEMLPEGPFGEFTGYYSSGRNKHPFIKVRRLYYQNRPIILGAPPVRPPLTNSGVHGRAVASAIIWSGLERAGMLDIRGVWAHEAGGGCNFLVISLKQRYAGQAAQVAFIASQIERSYGRYVVTVDEDIDPSNLDDVLWAMSTRCDPAEDIDILRRCWSSKLDPIMWAQKKVVSSRAVIDACIPFDLKGVFPASISVSQELREQACKYLDA